MQALAGSATLLVGGVLLVAAVAKLQDPTAFRTAVAGLVPRAAATVADAAVVAELLLGAWLMAGVQPGWASAAALVLLGVFSAALLRLRASGAEAACGCFGEPADGPGGPAAGLIRNALLALTALTVAAAPPSEPLWSRPVDVAIGEATVAIGLVALWTLARAAVQLAPLARRRGDEPRNPQRSQQ
jgi:hypothetical protein